MSPIPAFEIGVWNAWILLVAFLIVMAVPDLLMSKEAKESNKRGTQQVQSDNKPDKTWKTTSALTHSVIMPLALIYSVFLPLKTGTAWFYAGITIFVIAVVMTIMTSISYASTTLSTPVTTGIYRISRNPIYLNGFVLFISIGVVSASWVMMLFGVLWITLWNVALPAEERFLLEKYGDSYREYMERTPRWLGIPK